jgi:amino acid adenylation domain-containing protein
VTTAAPRRDTVAALTAAHGELHVFPTSFQQQRFWLLDQIDEAAAAYTVPIALRLEGALDVAALGRALQAVVDRHEALRTVFVLDGDAPAQVVLPSLRVALPVEDLSALPAEERDRAVTERARTNANAPFDLAAGPLVRVALLRLGAEAHVLLVALHHIVADGWSLGVLFSELDRAYAAYTAGAEPELPALPLQYADYAVWQRRVLGGAAAARQLDHWAERLAGVPPLELPTDRPRPAVQSLAGAKREARLDPDAAGAVRALARAQNVTPYVACLAAFVALLHRYTGQRDFAVGSITSGRRRVELEPLVGLFVNTLSLRVPADPDVPFAALLARVRDAAVDALANQDVPFEQVVERVQPTRDRSRSPIFQAAFQLLDGLAEEPRLTGLTVSSVAASKATAKFELTLTVRSAPDGGLVTVAEYNTDLFDAATIDRLLAHYAALLGAAARDASVAVGRLPLLGADERDVVVRRWNATEAPLPTWTVPERVLARAAAAPDAVAVRAADETLSYRELARRSALVARRLGSMGVRPGDRVAVCLERTAALPAALLGVLRAGAAYVPLDPSYPAERVAHVIGDAGARAVLTDPASRPRLPEMQAQVMTLDANVWAEPVDDDAALALPSVDQEDAAYVIYTSGSTGRPKGVVIPHRALSNFLASMAERPGLTADDAVVAVTTVAFDIAGLELWLPLACGAEVVLATRETAVDGTALRALVERTAARAAGRVLLQATPATWRLLLEAGWPGTPNLVMLCGGEAWPPGLAAQLRARGEALWNVYGPTETTIWSTRAHVTTDDVSLGEPLANTTLYVLEPTGEPAPLGVPGELWIGGAGLASGYHARPELTAERFVTHPAFGRLYRTGDRVRRSADGRLTYLGRLDDQVKVRGYRIELGEIESVLAGTPGVAQAVVAVRAAAPGDAQLVGYVVLDDGEREVPAAAFARLRAALPEYMVPNAIVLLDALPLTPNGKVDRRALPAPSADATSSARTIVAPRRPLEAQVAAVWAEVLGVAEVGAEDDFFALGGHSLLAMRVIARLADALPVRLTIGALFEARTVAGLAALVEQRLAAGEGACAIPRRADPSAPAPLSRAQELLWIYEQMTPGTSAYHVPIARRVRGPLDADALERALNVVVARHEALRTAFVETDGEARQIVRDAAPAVIEGHDLRDVPEAERAPRVAALLAEAVRRPFDLASSAGPRATLVRVGDEDALLLLVVHHLVCDGASLGVLLGELAESYAATARGEDVVLPPVPVHQADVAVWERAGTDGDAVAGAVEFWRAYLDGAPSAVDLPTDRLRPGESTAPASRVVRTFAPALRDGVRAFARAHDATPFMVLLAAYQTLLHRCAGQDDIVVGAPIAGRTRPETQRVVGHLADTLPLRASFAGDPTFAALLGRVREGSLRAFDRQDVGFERIARELRDGGAADAGSFNVAFVLQDGDAAATRLGEASIEPYGVEMAVAKFELTLSMTETADGLRASLEYRRDLFAAVTADRMLSRLGTLLEAAVAAPDTPVSALPLLDAAERAQLLAWADVPSGAPAGATVPALFDTQAARAPHAAAVAAEGRTLTYDALRARANRVAHALGGLGVRPGDRVGLLLDRSERMIVGMLGVLKAGAAYVPLDPAYPPERLALMARDAGLAVLVTEHAQLTRVPAFGLRPLLLDDDAPDLAACPDDAPAVDVRSEDAAYVIYTSGSTGTPKGVVVPHRAIARLVLGTNYVTLGADDVVAQVSSCSFDAATFEVWGALLNGARVAVVSKDVALAPEEFASELARLGVTTLFLTTALLNHVARHAPAALGALRHVLFGGELVDPRWVREILARGAPARLLHVYGPTEVTTYALWHLVRDVPADATTIPIGAPLAGTSAYVLDARGTLAPVGARGELYLGGDGVALGYLARPELTAERFVDDPFVPNGKLYRTGDVVRRGPDGAIEYVGRTDHQVKIRGFRIEPGEVESELAKHPAVRECVVVVLDAAAGGDRRLVAYVGAASAAATATELRGFLRRRLPDYMVPSAIVVLDALPLNRNGKVDRAALPAPTAEAEADEAAVAPRDDVERVVAQAFGDVLGHPPASVEANFFDLGGHSLLATRVVAQVLKIFRTKLPLRRFFDEPTVAGVARAVTAAEAKPGQAAQIAALLLRLQSMTPEERERLRRAPSGTDQSSR